MKFRKFKSHLFAFACFVFITRTILHICKLDHAILATKPNETEPIREFDTNIQRYIDTNVKKLKIFIANVNHEVNNGLIETARNYGHGKVLSFFENSSIVNFDTNQYALDLIFYERLLNDYSVQVRRIQEANVVYIPLMLGTLCTNYYAQQQNNLDISKYLDAYHSMALWLRDNEAVLKDKLILLVLSRSETVLTHVCPMRGDTVEIFRKHVQNLFIATHAKCEAFKCPFIHLNYTNILIPHATISRFALKPHQIAYKYSLNDNRVVDVFFSNSLKAKLSTAWKFVYDRVKANTNLSFNEFTKIGNIKTNQTLVVLFKIGQSYDQNLVNIIDWKLNSKICLEPHGDTPTRRSFWDSIFLGCIPVVFTNYELPFSDHIDYSRFVIRLNLEFSAENLSFINLKRFLKPYLQNSQWLHNAREYMSEIRQYIQSTWMYDVKTGDAIDPTFKNDAYGMMLAKLAHSL